MKILNTETQLGANISTSCVSVSLCRTAYSGAPGEEFAEFGARLVELGLGGADGAPEDARDLFVLIALNVVEDEGSAVAGRESGDGALQRDAVDQLRSLGRGRAHRLVRLEFFVFERVFAPRLVLAEAHQD